MKSFLVLGFFLLGSSFARGADVLRCQSSVGLAKAVETYIQINPAQSIPLFEVKGFKFKVNRSAGTKYEIEVFDANSESRSYASGSLDKIGSDLKWTLWSREILIDASCTLMRR